MNRVAAVVFLILCAGGTAFAQRGADDRDLRREQRQDSKYTYSTIVRCYTITDSLSSFTRCLHNYESPPDFPLRRDRYDDMPRIDDLREGPRERDWHTYRHDDRRLRENE